MQDQNCLVLITRNKQTKKTTLAQIPASVVDPIRVLLNENESLFSGNDCVINREGWPQCQCPVLHSTEKYLIQGRYLSSHPQLLQRHTAWSHYAEPHLRQNSQGKIYKLLAVFSSVILMFSPTLWLHCSVLILIVCATTVPSFLKN